MKARVVAWAPALILGVGALFTVGIDTQRALPLRTIHSPKSCLAGAGWEALTSSTHVVELPGGSEAATVNRYLIQRGEERALVFYWYQGRGRIEANEYRVKLDLLLDSAFRSRSDEALVRLVVPVTTSVEDAGAVAETAAANIIPALTRALPE